MILSMGSAYQSPCDSLVSCWWRVVMAGYMMLNAATTAFSWRALPCHPRSSNVHMFPPLRKNDGQLRQLKIKKNEHDEKSDLTPFHYPSPPLIEAKSTRKRSHSKQTSTAPAPTTPPLMTLMNGQPYNPNATLTLSDLQSILTQNGYVRRSDEDFRYLDSTNKKSLQSTSSSSSSFSSSSSGKGKSSGKVAFPQPSQLTPQAISRGTTVVGALLGCAIAYTLFPNLWLVGVMTGSTYGNHIAAKDNARTAAIALASAPTNKRKKQQTNTAATAATTTATSASSSSTARVNVANMDHLALTTTTTILDNEDDFDVVSTILLTLGKKLASVTLQVIDIIKSIWFMYKTGQLSYTYYKQYEKLDQKFALQKKMDAWNARFLEGKVKFDAWEKEHEVGRKVMAGLRTFWLVEEVSYKKMSSPKKGVGKWRKYRIVRMAQDVATFLRRLIHALFKLLTGGGSTELQEISQGIQAGISELNFERVGQQIGSGLVLIAALNVVGALFLMSPNFTGFLAFGVGFIYPTWIAGSYRRVTSTLQTTAEKGRKQLLLKKDAALGRSGGTMTRSSRVGGGGGGKYHYFVRSDGSKRWYRTGRSMFYSYGDAAASNGNLLSNREQRQDKKKRGWAFWKRKEKMVDEGPSWMHSLPFSSKD